MAGQRFGKNDPDIKMKGSKEKTDKPLRGMGSDPIESARIGGVSNGSGERQSYPKATGKAGNGRVASFAKGGMVGGSNQGGFRNRAMEHKR